MHSGLIQSEIPGDIDAYSLVDQPPSDGSSCAVTGEGLSLKYCHILQSELWRKNADQLEYAFGLLRGTLGRDTNRALLVLREDLCGSFNQGDWVLMPNTEIIDRLVFCDAVNGGSIQRNMYEELSSEETYEYQLLYIANDSSDQREILDARQTIQSRLHPCYVVCDTARKVETLDYRSADEELEERLGVCCGLLDEWLIAKPYVIHKPSPRLSSPSPSCFSQGSTIFSDDLELEQGPEGRCGCLARWGPRSQSESSAEDGSIDSNSVGTSSWMEGVQSSGDQGDH